MDLIENIVANWFNSQGYFVIQNLKIGVNEVDILAVKLDEGKKVIDVLQVEVQCSSNPIGYIGGSSSAKKRSSLQIAKGVKSYIDKKWNNKKIKSRVEKLIGKNYRKLFICGNLKDETTVEFFKKNDVDVIRVWDIFKEIEKNEGMYKTGEGNRYHQLLHLNNMDRKENNAKIK